MKTTIKVFDNAVISKFNNKRVNVLHEDSLNVIQVRSLKKFTGSESGVIAKEIGDIKEVNLSLSNEALLNLFIAIDQTIKQDPRLTHALAAMTVSIEQRDTVTVERYKEMMKELERDRREIEEFNLSLLRSINPTMAELDFKDMIEDCTVVGKIEFVNEPAGDPQFEDDDYFIFKNICVDQWSTNESGDAFAGYIYAQIISNSKWIRIPYEC